MDYLPLFAAIKEKPVLVVGTGEIADRKIAFLQRAGAQVRVVAEADFDESQIDSVVLVIAATEDRDLNRRVSDAAQARYRLVNVVDDQPLCSFIFPSIVDRSPLLVAISSGGTAPVLPFRQPTGKYPVRRCLNGATWKGNCMRSLFKKWSVLAMTPCRRAYLRNTSRA